MRINPQPLPGDPKPWQQKVRPTARVVSGTANSRQPQLANLTELLRVLPYCLNSNGREVIISFQSGENCLIKAAFKEGLRSGVYAAISAEPLRATFAERGSYPRSRSANLRWARRTG